MAHTFAKLLAHIIFSTKDRVPLIDSDLKTELYAYVGGIVREHRGKTLVVNGQPDHVHLLLSLSPAIALSDLVRLAKTNSSKWIHEKWPERSAFAWQTGYGAFSVSQSNTGDVMRYIARQEEHHKKTSFQEEFIAFLKRHGVEYDERYIWE